MLVWVYVFLWVLGSVIDNLTTYYAIYVVGGFAEANPIQSWVVYGMPLFLWFVFDAAAMVMVWLVARYLKRLSPWLGAAVLVEAAAVRLYPAIHNLYCLSTA